MGVHQQLGFMVCVDDKSYVQGEGGERREGRGGKRREGRGGRGEEEEREGKAGRGTWRRKNVKTALKCSCGMVSLN